MAKNYLKPGNSTLMTVRTVLYVVLYGKFTIPGIRKTFKERKEKEKMERRRRSFLMLMLGAIYIYANANKG